MSAIVGLFRRDGATVSPDVFNLMLKALSHRGPDGTEQWQRGPIALGQQYRHITREELNEPPPLQDSATGLVLVSDCRLDNRDELGEALAIPPSQRSHIPDSHFLWRAFNGGERAVSSTC